MTVKQISVFLENKPGQLAEFADVLRKNGIDMRALSMAETKDFGILRIIVNDPDKTGEVLKNEQYVFSVTPVLAVEISDASGGLYEILHLLADANINLEYTYAFITRKKGVAYTVLRVDDNEKAADVLETNGIKLASEEVIAEL